MRYLLTLIACLSLVGCATRGPVPLPIDNLAASVQAPVEDLRPEGEGTQEFFSLSIFSERYGYIRIAQDMTEPTGPRLFAHRLYEKHAPGPAPVTKLHHFAVYLNSRTKLLKTAVGAGLGGAIGAVAASATYVPEGEVVHTIVDSATFASLSGDDEYKRSLCTDSELKTGTSAFIVFIESESQGQRRFTRTVSPVKPIKPGERIPLQQALEAAIHFHLNP